ncbi:uncharacterized protein LOC106879105 [Octopus bimaculoides]|uniref:uncharacterized protein LOC106879105 n=1 Tax=Octopus bimaculoides TaxID=37653 RepID=UPI00071CC139|nr:uncharacterized protein LOC106879105 [Octopus bimaculoides]|eukprot:XP_014784030.1 PREDICTED: uncharacterized protein LOC106879105 [Octopus bimaculoides]
MTFVRHFGHPDLFIIFTCNPKWIEIEIEPLNSQRPTDRHDLLARVFRLKLQKLMDLIKIGQVFGSVKCDMYTVEWQKRGLPHAHILLWLSSKINSNNIDSLISAELPDPVVDPDIFQIVRSNMIHGPCGYGFNIHSPCFRDSKCMKGFLKKFQLHTQMGNDSYPLYRRRRSEDSELTVKVEHHEVDNRWIVPFCPLLSKAFNAHINVEFCSSIKSIKYVCKYINKGTDAATFCLQQNGNRDEVAQYQVGRYITSNEAFWRIFGFPLQQRHPPIQQLAIHLENSQLIYFTPSTAATVVEYPKDTTLTAFSKLCNVDTFVETLLYYQVPSYYSWSNNTWQRRRIDSQVDGFPTVNFDTCLGRIYTVHPSQQECFYLRLLLHDVRGPKSFQHLKTVNGEICSTFREACLRYGLLENDSKWDATLAEAANSRSAKSLRALFAILLHICEVSDPVSMWLRYRNELAEDYYQLEKRRVPEINSANDQIYNCALIDIENKIVLYGLPATLRDESNFMSTKLIREMSYNADTLAQFIDENEPKLLPKQQQIINTVLGNVQNQKGGIFFLDAPGGTGKTFLIKLLLSKVRLNKVIALAVASSGIAATLLAGGRTAHSAFKLPLDLAKSESPSCNITRTSEKGMLLQKCQFIVWDECTMAHRRALEALNTTLQDIRDCPTPMGGITLLLFGDFRQTLPVIPKGTRADEVSACVKSSLLWQHVTTLTLTTNMRTKLHNDQQAAQFASNALSLGDGKLMLDGDGQILISSICTPVSTVEELTRKVFPRLYENYRDIKWLCERAILASKNGLVNAINDQLLQIIPASLYVYKSMDSFPSPNQVVNYPIEFLNSLEPPRLPPHKLGLKLEFLLYFLGI